MLDQNALGRRGVLAGLAALLGVAALPLEALAASTGEVADREKLELAAKRSMAHRRRERIDGAERAKGQATCRHCREPIPKGDWRIRLTFFDEGQFSGGGFIHLACIKPYFETGDILEQVLHFSRALSADDREGLGKAIAAAL